MDRPSSQASSLLHKLENHDFAAISTLFSTYLHPILSPESQNPKPKPSKSKKSSSSAVDAAAPSIRSLVKAYLPSLNKFLSLLPKRLFESPKRPETSEFCTELLESYRICLDCLDVLSAELCGKPYGVHLQRARYVHCLLRWERYEEGFEEGFMVLKALGRVRHEDWRWQVEEGEVLPKLIGNYDDDDDGDEGLEREFGRLVVDLVVVVSQCVAAARSKEASKYSCLLVMLQEVGPWFRHVEASARSKLQWKLLAQMKSVANLLVRDVNHFKEDLVIQFCAATFDEYISLLNGQSHQSRTTEDLEEFVQFLYTYAYKCRSTCINMRFSVATHLNKSAGGFSKEFVHFSLIQRLYAMGLYLSEFGAARGSSDASSSAFLPEGWNKLQDLSSLLESAKNYYHLESHLEGYLSLYLSALKFSCGTLAQFVYSERKRIVKEELKPSLRRALELIQQALLEYCCLFQDYREKGGQLEIDSNIASISISSFTLSLKLCCKTKESKKHINFLAERCFLSAQPQVLNYMVVMLHNLFVEFYRYKQWKEALKAGVICFKASWIRCLLLCEIFVGKFKESDGELSENMILDSANEACKESSLLAEVLHQTESHKLDKLVSYGLEKWCLARNLVELLPCPEALVRCWVKKQCKLYTDANAHAPILACSPCVIKLNVSSATVGMILEQELELYEKYHSFHPNFCQRMQMAIIDTLLQKVYSCSLPMQRSAVLAKKGMSLRSNGYGCLEDCICCLSEAIDLIDGSYNDASPSHQLAILHCLRALCTQEGNPNSQEMFKDIREAVKLLSSDDLGFPSNDENNMGYDFLKLLYHIADLLSIKGDTTLHSEVLDIILKVFKRMNTPSEKCLLLLWESRRVNHALCVTPVSEAFIASLSKNFGEEVESLEFWIDSVKDSQPLLVGLQQNFSFLSSLFPLAFNQHKCAGKFEFSVDEVKQVAEDLISRVPVPSRSAFLAAYLYHGLSERLCARGKIVEALFCAREALQLRSKLLQEHFSFSFEQHDVNHAEVGEATQLSSKYVSQINVISKAAVTAWPGITKLLEKPDEFVLTPWNVLCCFLESSMQVGIVHELLGNVAEAESHFMLGKSISCLQNLPLFITAFSCCLAKIYRGLCLLNSAYKELKNAQQVLDVEKNLHACLRCSVMLEGSINEQLGDLYGKGLHCSTENSYEVSLKSLISLENGDLAVWLEEESSGHRVFCSGVGTDAEPASSGTAILGPNSRRTKAKVEPKKSRKTQKELDSLATDKPSVPPANSRVTRSKKQSSLSKKGGLVENVTNHLRERKEVSDFDGVDCEKCLLGKLKAYASFTSLIQMKWEYMRRRQILKLLIGLGKCHGGPVTTLRPLKIYAKCISILLGGSDCHCSGTSPLGIDYSGEKFPADALAVECADVFYNFCWFILKALYSEDIRSVPDDVRCIEMAQLISLLMNAFVLSSEVPWLFQEVSRVLSVIYVVSASKENLSSHLPSCKLLSENHWAAYFHQASVGAHHNLQLLSAITANHGFQMTSKVKGTQAAIATSVASEMRTLLSIVPQSTEQIEKYVLDFFEDLPNSAIICVSLLGDSYISLLQGMVHCPSTIYGWMLLSHFGADSQPAVILLPISSALQGEGESALTFEDNVGKEWRCPWGSRAQIDGVAPLFRSILRANYLSCSSSLEEGNEQNCDRWWAQRFDLDKLLQKLLWEMEESWFGQWKYLLLGQWLDAQFLNPAVKKLRHEIEDKCKLVVNESILKIVVGGIKSTDLENEKIPKVFIKKGCYIGSMEHFDRERCYALDVSCAEGDYIPGPIIAAVNKREVEYCTRREPVILVLDSNFQMLPFENMPIMKEQEVYRMPSVASIFVALQRRPFQEEAVRLAGRFPLIDPLDAFYLLNPSGDLARTQADFEEWFKSQDMQGKAGVVPSTEELAEALVNHDLFLYFGHGSGAQYLPAEKIRKLENCAATVLMGCSSGSLNLRGCYPPVGIPLSYMLAGAPIVVANLWEVTDGDIDRFAKAVLKSFMDERSMFSAGCIQCSLLAEELEALNVNGRKVNTKKGRGKKKSIDSQQDLLDGYCFRHKLRAGYFVSQARKACKLPYLIGAAPVCYGVPTGIKKKRDSKANC